MIKLERERDRKEIERMQEYCVGTSIRYDGNKTTVNFNNVLTFTLAFIKLYRKAKNGNVLSEYDKYTK